MMIVAAGSNNSPNGDTADLRRQLRVDIDSVGFSNV
jgi:hypothetical protein